MGSTYDRASEILERLRDSLGEPARRSSDDPVRGLVGTILSQNTSDTNSSNALAALFDAFPTWQSVADADPDDLAETIRCGGLANQKAPTIQRALEAIGGYDASLAGSFLDEMSDSDVESFLTSIKGVGRKTAACVMLFDLDRDVLPVDTHVHRVSRRLGLVPDSTSAVQTQTLLEAQIEPEDRYAAHVLLIRHGRQTCHARSPKCVNCVLNDICAFAGDSRVAA